MIQERILEYLDYKGISKYKFYKDTGLSNGFLDKRGAIGSDKCELICYQYKDINPEWLLTGTGEMLRSDADKNNYPSETLIPLYSDVVTFGGTGSVADMKAVSKPTEYINAGDWFRDATAALKHYGDSMNEYPSGCVLLLKELFDKRIIPWGQNFCIETKEFRITKRLQRSQKEGYIIAYSSNEEAYKDGTLIHQPIDIHIDDIDRMFLVLGYVVTNHSSSMVAFR